MASYEELKQRVRNGQTASTQTQTKVTSYEELKKKAKQERFEEDVKKVDDSYINLFVNTANSFLKSASEESGKVGWGNASASYDDRYKAYEDLNYRQRVISTWLDANKGNMPEDSYKDMLGLIGSYNSSANSVVSWFKDTKDFYSQWDTEEDYNFWKDHSTKEGRQNWYAEQQSRLEKLKADRTAENSSWSEVDPIVLGVESVEYQTAAQKHTSRLKEIDDEIAAIETEMRNYERGNYNKDGQYYGSKVVDDYQKYAEAKDFGTVSANRDFDNPTRDELTQYDALNDSSTWYYDENGVFRDAYGNEVEKDSSGKWVNPKAQEYAVTDRLGIYLSASQKDIQEYMGTIVSGTWGNIIGEGIDGSWDQLTDNEIAIYYYLLNESGQETADKYLSDMKRELNRRSTTANIQQLSDSFDDAGLLEKIALNAATVPAQLFSGIASAAENAAYTLRGQDINPYSSAHSGMHFSNTVRSETAEDIDATGIKIPVLDFTLGDAYQAGMSILDSYAAIGIGGNFGGALLATTAASSEATRLYEQGASMQQIALGSAAAGAAEMVFESLSIEKLINMKDATTVGQMVKNALIQAGVEASEEGFTEIANIITNSIIMGNQSDWAQLVEEYDGDTWQAFLTKVKDVANASLAGFISGAGSAGAPSAVNAVATYAQQQAQYKNAGKAINYAEGGVDALLSLANDVAGVSEGSVQKQLTNGIASVEKNASDRKVGKLYDTVQTANNLANAPQNQADIVKSLTRRGFKAETATDIAEALIARYNGKELNKVQTRLLASVENSEAVKSAVSSIMFNAKSTMGQRSQNIRDFDSGISTGIISRTLGVDTKTANKAAQKEFTPEGTYETSVEGKAIRTDTGDVVDIQGVASIQKGEMLLDIGDGNTVNAKEVSYATKEQALIYEAVANMGERIDATTANKLIARYKGGDAIVFARGMAQAYTYGFYGLDTSEMLNKKSFASDLPQEQRNYAYNLGSQYRNVKDRADKANANAAKAAGTKGVYYRSKDGTVTDFRSYEKDSGIALKDVQKTAIEAMEKMSQIMGVRFNVFESWVENGKHYYLDENGVKTEGNPNGFYDPKTGEIYIDLAAGNDYQGTMLFTVAHELTHFMRQWSPEHFTKIARIVFKHGGMKGNVSELVAAKQAKAKARGKVLSYDTAMEEAVADGMETILKDGNVVEFMAEVKQKDHTAWEKLKEWFKNLAEFLRDLVKAYSGHSAQTTEGARVAAFSQDLLRQIEKIFAEGAVAAGENYQAAMENVVEKNAEAVPADEIITDGAVVTDGEGVKFSIKSMKHDIAEGQMFEDLKTYCGWTQKQVNELRQNLQELVEYMTPFRDILDMNESYGREGRRFSPYNPNSDPLYKISMDFSTLCSKRLLTQYVIENLQLRENRPMSAEEQMAIRDMLNEYRKVEKGLQVACAMCYVEAARLKSPQQIGKWLADPETQMRNYFADKDPEFSAYIKEKQADFKESRGYARNATKKDMSAKDVRELNNIRPRVRSQYKLTAEEAKIVERAKALPNSTYLTAANLANLSETDPIIYSAYTAFVRTATRSKSLETDEPYYYGDSRRDNGNGIVVSDSFIEAVNRENGMRFSSWSDWRIQHLLDYITAVIDNSVRGAAMHGYTKFGEEVRVLGKTGMMFNMSGVAGTQTGLNEDGSLSFSPTESVDVNEAIQLRDEFPETAGLQCIGVSDAHIIAMLRSDIIDYIIPYHVSGLNAALRRMADIFGWDDYTSSQHAAIDKSIKFENAVDQEHWHEEPVWSEFFVGYNTGMTGIEAMRESANRYVQMCKDRGLKPKFEQFLKEENYWKLLIDRKMINQKTGKLIQQKAVTPTFDFGTIKEVVDRYVQNYDSGMEARALNHIVENWDSIPKRIRDLKKQGGTKAKKASKAVDTLANQTLAAQPKKLSDRDLDTDSKYSLREAVVPTRAELEKKDPIKVVDISTAQTKGTFAERRKQILKDAQKIISKPYFNKDTKTMVFLTEKSYAHAFSNMGELQINAAEHLPQFIENAVLTHADTATHGSDYTDGVYTFFAAARAGHIMPVKLKVKEYIYAGQDMPKNIKAYFESNPQGYASSYDTVVLEVEEIEKSPSGSAKDMNQDDSFLSPDELSTIKVADLLALVKGESEKYIPKFSDRDAGSDAKKGNRMRSMRPGFQGPVTDSTFSVSELVENVNQYFTDVLSDDATEIAEQVTDVMNTTKFSDRDQVHRDETYSAIGKELLVYEEGDMEPDLTLVEMVNERTGKTETTIKHFGQKPKNYVPKRIAYCYKLFEQHPDGSLHALFAGARSATPIGEWQYAKGFPYTDEGVKGMNLRERYGWHLSAGLPSAPHLMSTKDFARGYPSKGQYGHPKGSKRVWVRMAYDASTDFNAIADSTKAGDVFGLIPFGGYYAFKENNQSEWVISSAVKIDKILTEDERQQILRDAGYDEYEAWRKKHRATDAEKAENKRKSAENKKAKDKAIKAGLNYLSESSRAMRESIQSRIIDNPELKYSDRDSDDKQLTEDQLEFFEESKVRDEMGRLKVLYHGSRYEAFTEFDISQGVWLTPVQSYAEVYAEMWHTWRDDMDGAKRDDINGLEPSVYADPDYRLYKMYANIKNPADIGELNQELTSTVVRKLARVLGVNYSRVKAMASDYEGQWTYEMTRSEEFIELAHQQGFDGFKATENGKETWCAFDSPNQVKLTTNEVPSGFYDIRYQDRAEESVSNRSLLANAFDGVAQNEIERNKIREYKDKIALVNAEEKKLHQLNQQIKDLSFAKGPKDTKKIRELQFEATQTANRISTYDKMLLRLEASKPLQDVLTREKEMVRKREKQKGKAALEAYREKTMKTQRELLDKWQKSRKNGIESRRKTEMRHKIKAVVDELNQYLLKGTKDRHVPIGLQKDVAAALDAVNMDTVGAEERIAKLNEELRKAKSPEVIRDIVKRIDNIREMGDRMDERLKKMKAYYDEFINSDDPLIANSHDEGMAAHMMKLIVRVGDTPLRDMTLDQLQDVYDVYKIVLATIRNANKSFKDNKNREISTRANQVMAEIDSLGIKRGKRIAGFDWIEKFGWDNLKPVYAMEHIGSRGLIDAYNNVRAGEDTWARDIVEAREYYLDMSKKYGYDSWNFEKKSKFTSTTGKDFELTLDQIMSLYAYSKRDQAEDHMKYGGIVFDPKTEVVEQTKHGIKVKYNVANATSYNISEETLAAIISELTDDQKGFVDEMQMYLSDVMGAKGNEVSLAMYDVKLFREKFYFPLKTAPQYMAKAKEQAQGEVKIKNSGFSKETKPHAKNPIVLSSFMDVWSGHVNEMSMYHAFVLPMEDFYRIYNYTTPSKNENLPTEGVNAYIENAFGTGATGYIEQMLKDLNGGARTDSTTGIINKMMGLFKKGAVFASLSVVVQQPSAIARAAALVDTKYFIGPKVDHKKHKLLWDEVKQYAPVAVIKEMGYFDTNMGKSTQDFIQAKEYEGFKEKMKALVTDSGYQDEILSKAPALADEIAWCSIWEAVKRETHANNPGMDVKSEAFLKLAGERFTEVIVKTQVYDSVLSRSALMRSKDTGMKMATAFMAEPTTSINMIADALLQGKRGNRKYARAAIGSVIASQIINSILVSFVYAGRDDDEDETYWEKYIGTLTGEIFDSLNPAGYIPFIKDIQSIVKGYDVERSDMAVISDLWNAWQNLSKDSVSVYRKVEGFAGSIAQIFGLPLKNIMRDVRGIYQTVMSFVNGQQTTGSGMGYAIKGAITGKDVSNQQQLYEAMLRDDQAHIARVKARFKDQNAINSAIRSMLRENDPRIKEAAAAKVRGDLDDYLRIAKEIIGEKHFSQDDVVRAINSEINSMSSSESTTTQKASGMFKAEDFAVAISQGDQAMANAIKVDIIQTEQKNGKSAEDAEKSFNSSAVSACKDLFLSGDISESQAINALKTYCGKTADGAMADVQYWAFKQDYPDVHADDQWFDTYYEKIADSGISIDVYMEYRNKVATITGEGKKEGRMAAINSLPITSAQKDALYFAEGWAESKLSEAPWH